MVLSQSLFCFLDIDDTRMLPAIIIKRKSHPLIPATNRSCYYF
jgi:hypothetical protein